jgi:hypothetical protein
MTNKYLGVNDLGSMVILLFSTEQSASGRTRGLYHTEEELDSLMYKGHIIGYASRSNIKTLPTIHSVIITKTSNAGIDRAVSIIE